VAEVAGVQIAFTGFGIVTLVAGFLVVTTDNLVHAALWLALALVGLGGCYLLVAAEFVALVQILIYVGAVVVLLLFALMLTRAPTGPLPGLTTRAPGFAAVAGGVAALGLFGVLATAFRGARIDTGHGLVGSTHAVGVALFTTWVLPFEVLSLLLLAALIGAIAVSRRAADDDEWPGDAADAGD
jgi:NADH-quinone oxidoreductase subunit J